MSKVCNKGYCKDDKFTENVNACLALCNGLPVCQMADDNENIQVLAMFLNGNFKG